MNVKGGENPTLFKRRKSVMCFVLHIAKENKLRGNINVERSSNVITFSATECMCLQSCLYSFSISSISEEEICSVFLVISPGKFPNTYR